MAIRPIERFSVAAPEPQPDIAIIPVDQSRAARAAALISTAEQLAARCREEAEQARPLIASADGAAPGSEAWVAAQQALSRVSGARSGVAKALADLDALTMAAADGGVSAAELQSLADASDQIAQLEERVRVTLATLEARLKMP